MDAVGEHLLVANMMRMIFDGGGDLCFICNIINVTIDGIVIRLEIIIEIMMLIFMTIMKSVITRSCSR